MSRVSQLSFGDHRKRTGRGGPREGAGRKPSARPVVHHVRRSRFRGMQPAIVTLRVRGGVGSLRLQAVVKALRESFARACQGDGFRVVHYSIQTDHVHMIVEADGEKALGRGMNSVSARVARAVNRVFRRTGKVLAGRYHVRLLGMPREVRNALRYVLLNFRKHVRQRTGAVPRAEIDGASSGRWFDGWRRGARLERRGRREVAEPLTWLLRVGWRRYGLIDPGEVPGRV